MNWPGDYIQSIGKAGCTPFSQSEAGLLYCGDCLDIMKGIPDGAVDLVVTDPPYGVNVAEWDTQTPTQAFLSESLRIGKTLVMFGAAPTRCLKAILGLIPAPDRIYIWHNTFTLTNSDGAFWSYQPIYVYGKLSGMGRDVISMAANDGATTDRLHPCQKPVKLMEKLLNGTEAQVILDPFAGSGTTLVAAKQLGRKYIGIEISEQYCKIAEDRLRQGELFGGAA